MSRSGKGIQNCFFLFWAPVPQSLKMCCFNVFKIHVKTVNRKSLMVHVYTSVYGFVFNFYL